MTTGWLKIVGLGAGNSTWLTPEAFDILHNATDIVGYSTYISAVPKSVTATLHASDNGVEVERAEYALTLATQGKKVAVISSGDAGIFGMASAVFEAVENGDTNWRNLDIEVVPAVSALLAVAARVGSPLGHDFCVISLSSYLKPIAIIEKRLRAAIDGDFVLVVYNPTSKHRGGDFLNHLAILRALADGDRVAIIATNVGREHENITITTLAELNPDFITMNSLLIIGSSKTRKIMRDGKEPIIYTPRYYEATL